MRTNETGLFPALEEALKTADEPMDCQTLYDMPAIRQHAASANRVSDYLGGLWRKGLVVRLPAPKTDNSRARWMYMWKGRRPAPLPTMDEAVEFGTKKMLLQRPSIEISETGNMVTIELPNWVLTIKSRWTEAPSGASIFQSIFDLCSGLMRTQPQPRLKGGSCGKPSTMGSRASTCACTR